MRSTLGVVRQHHHRSRRDILIADIERALAIRTRHRRRAPCQTASVTAGAAASLVDDAAAILGAVRGRLYVADYSMRRLQRLDASGPVGSPHEIAGSLVGRAFTSGQVSCRSPTRRS